MRSAKFPTYEKKEPTYLLIVFSYPMDFLYICFYVFSVFMGSLSRRMSRYLFLMPSLGIFSFGFVVVLSDFNGLVIVPSYYILCCHI